MTALVEPSLERPSWVPRGVAVPWRVVLPLAVLMAYADGFWITSLRGAVGAIERTQSPFASWLRESTVVLPVYVLAVLGALTLALHWFGPGRGRTRAVLMSLLLVVAAGTVVALAELVASSAYDYHLQTQQLQLMASAHHSCTGSCLAAARESTLAVHIRAVLYLSRWLLLTNLVLVAWMVAIWGGRLTVGSTSGADLRAAGDSTTGAGVAKDIRLLLVTGLAASAAIHAAVVPQHLTEWPAAGAFFVFLTAAELAVAGLLLAAPARRQVLVAAAVVSMGPLVIWLCSRTAGLPFGPERGAPEAVGLPDVMACALELGCLVAAVVLLRSAGLGRRPLSAHVRALGLVTLLAVTTIGLAGAGPSWLDAFGIGGDHAVMDMSH